MFISSGMAIMFAVHRAFDGKWFPLLLPLSKRTKEVSEVTMRNELVACGCQRGKNEFWQRDTALTKAVRKSVEKESATGQIAKKDRGCGRVLFNASNQWTEAQHRKSYRHRRYIRDQATHPEVGLVYLSRIPSNAIDLLDFSTFNCNCHYPVLCAEFEAECVARPKNPQ